MGCDATFILILVLFLMRMKEEMGEDENVCFFGDISIRRMIWIWGDYQGCLIIIDRLLNSRHLNLST